MTSEQSIPENKSKQIPITGELKISHFITRFLEFKENDKKCEIEKVSTTDHLGFYSEEKGEVVIIGNSLPNHIDSFDCPGIVRVGTNGESTKRKHELAQQAKYKKEGKKGEIRSVRVLSSEYKISVCSEKEKTYEILWKENSLVVREPNQLILLVPTKGVDLTVTKCGVYMI